MRLALIIVSLAAIAVALVHIRRAEVDTQHEIQRLRTEQIARRQRLWDQQTRIEWLGSPEEITRLQMLLNLPAFAEAPRRQDDGFGARDARPRLRNP